MRLLTHIGHACIGVNRHRLSTHVPWPRPAVPSSPCRRLPCAGPGAGAAPQAVQRVPPHLEHLPLVAGSRSATAGRCEHILVSQPPPACAAQRRDALSFIACLGRSFCCPACACPAAWSLIRTFLLSHLSLLSCPHHPPARSGLCQIVDTGSYGWGVYTAIFSLIVATAIAKESWDYLQLPPPAVLKAQQQEAAVAAGGGGAVEMGVAGAAATLGLPAGVTPKI